MPTYILFCFQISLMSILLTENQLYQKNYIYTYIEQKSLYTHISSFLGQTRWNTCHVKPGKCSITQYPENMEYELQPTSSSSVGHGWCTKPNATKTAHHLQKFNPLFLPVLLQHQGVPSISGLCFIEMYRKHTNTKVRGMEQAK